MENDIKFTSIKELYDRLLPALKTKVNDLKRKNISFINEKNIWDYLSKKIWANKTDLELCEMVNDILNIDENSLLNETYNNNF